MSFLNVSAQNHLKAIKHKVQLDIRKTEAVSSLLLRIHFYGTDWVLYRKAAPEKVWVSEGK